ncbi:hypothetical protein RM555_15455 [Micromonospora sp. DSM 115977]|uniref:DNA-3-methyladenine glycosylase II n=1 Tax=Micromonospora reichwaldensis TaxID=3075516 RepID=A0ABU2WWZ5_9ACTN|nr:hypothetical protein [Micromonospora sp. DSM 115977]MDT0530387.1 hypothetical protein [Micromonospora sp. DSM 115977]
MGFDYLMTDHPAWQPDGDSFHRLMTDDENSAWLLSVRGSQASFRAVSGDAFPPLVAAFAVPPQAPPPAAPIHQALSDLGTVGRPRNPSLWDAMATAIVRQVIRAGQARRLYRDFCLRFGSRVALSGEKDIHSFPSPERVLTLSDDDFTHSGMAFKRRPLRHAARAFLAQGESWSKLSPSVLVKELQTIPGIGPWSAGAAVADWSNDWALYPYGDLAVRTWARRANPDHHWPADEPSFARTWRRVTGDSLATYTVLTLALGCRHSGSI